MIRAIGVLEGIALVGDPQFAIVDEAYPYISRRLLTDRSPRSKAALRYMVYGEKKRFDVDRVIDMLQAFERFAAVKKLAAGTFVPAEKPAEERETGLVRLDGEVPIRRRDVEPEPDADAARDALSFFFGADGEVFRDFLLEELAASVACAGNVSPLEAALRVGDDADRPWAWTAPSVAAASTRLPHRSLDAGARASLSPPRLPLATPRVRTFLSKLSPELTEDDRKSIVGLPAS